jgi:hypothetical protein
MWCHFCEGTGVNADGKECEVCLGSGYEPRPWFRCDGKLQYPEGKKAYEAYNHRASRYLFKKLQGNEFIENF